MPLRAPPSRMSAPLPRTGRRSPRGPPPRANCLPARHLSTSALSQGKASGGQPPDGPTAHIRPAQASFLKERAGLEPELSHVSGTLDELSLREEHLASGGLPEPEIPTTRQASRENRVGAPFYVLVDFAASVDVGDRLGLEAAALGSGVADAWITPDGRLLSGDDGRPLLDTQLDASAAPLGGTTL